MSRVAIVTDSSAYIPKEMVRDLPVTIIPLSVHWDNETFLDGITLSTDEMAHRLRYGTSLPTTSQAPPERFTSIFSSLVDQGFNVLSINVSRKLSGVYQSALLAASRFDHQVRVMDSENTAMALGFLVLKAARAASQGASLDECQEIVKVDIPKAGACLLPESLDFLYRSGRINQVSHLLGSLLKITPIIELYKEVRVARRVRTAIQAVDALLETAENRIAGCWPVRMAFLHIGAQSKIEELKQIALKRWGVSSFVEIITGEASPTLACHIGPGAIGIAYLAEGK